MSATPLQLSTTPNGDLLTASSPDDGPSLTLTQDTFDTGFRSTLTFTRGSEQFLTVTTEIAYRDEGTIDRSSLAATGPGVDYRLALAFADDPADIFSGGKLNAVITVESGGGTHHGRFDGETWHAVGLEGTPNLPALLRSACGPLLSPLSPALDLMVAGAIRRSGGAFSPTPGRPPTLPYPAPGTLETFGWRDRLCKMACAVAATATASACCAATGAETGGAGCVVCAGAAAAAGTNCSENCSN
jgi:hypothetical protein